MNKENVEILTDQIKNIIMNKPVGTDIDAHTDELRNLQEAINYLSNSLSESNEFLKELGKGNLEAKVPSRHNFLAGSLKELHSGLMHITWQAEQVAKGDYHQKVSFLGNFSMSFNSMIAQLSERETRLKEQSLVLKDTVDLMIAIMDGLNDWVLVNDANSGEILYANKAALDHFITAGKRNVMCNDQCEIMKRIKNKNDDEGGMRFEHECEISGRRYVAKTFFIHWDDTKAYANFITDVTAERLHQQEIESMAYKDDLTGLFNRRYCLEKMDEFRNEKIDYTLCMLDIDGLKYVNDNFGHVTGDDYLKIVANSCLNGVRSTDIVCRIGGDEIVILFPLTDVESIKEKMVEIEKTIMTQSTTEYYMDISYGLVYIEKGSNKLTKDIIREADERMYEQKGNKREGM